MTDCSRMLVDALRDPANGWSIGTFGAIGEFVRDCTEECRQRTLESDVELVTNRGAIRVSTHNPVTAIAYETFVGDGETWGNAVAFCVPTRSGGRERTIQRLGCDEEALLPNERHCMLFDLGVGAGHVAMCVRTSDPELVDSLDAMTGRELLSEAATACTQLILKKSPARVLLSPLGRIEVYAPIPQQEGKSPAGPHTHLLPKLIASGRTHSANAPIPVGLQPVLMMHPRSPWRDSEGRRTPYDAERSRAFDVLLRDFGLEEDRRLRADVETAIRQGKLPGEFPEPPTRRGRTQLRIILRRLSRELGSDVVRGWRETHDALAGGPDEVDVAAA